MIRTSVCSCTPLTSATRPRTSSMQLTHVACRRAGFGLDEVGVLVAHERAADACALQPGAVDETARAVARRVAEHRPRVRAAGLVVPPPPHDFVDASQALAAGRRRVTPNVAPTTTSRAPRPLWRYESASESTSRRLAAALVERDHLGADQHLHGLAPVAARVHPHRPADRARDAHEELEAGPPGRSQLACEHRERDAPARTASRRYPVRSSPTPPASGICTASKSPSSTMPTPGKPLSARSRFEPRPMGAPPPRGRARRRAPRRRRHRSRCTTSAIGPPTRQVVSVAAGTSRSHRTRPASAVARPRRSRRLHDDPRCAPSRLPERVRLGDRAAAERHHDVARLRHSPRHVGERRPSRGCTRARRPDARRASRRRRAAASTPAIGSSKAPSSAVITTTSASANTSAYSCQWRDTRV